MKKLFTSFVLFALGAFVLSACDGDSTDAHEHDSSAQHGDHEDAGHSHGDDDHDHGSTDAATLTAAGISNKNCPIMDDPVDPKFTATFQGKKIGFCCEDCVPKWEKLSDDEKAKKLNK